MNMPPTLLLLLLPLSAQADPRAARDQAIANLTIHLCVPPAGQPRPTSGQYFILRLGQIVSQGACRLALAPYPASSQSVSNPDWFQSRPWLWIERISADYSVPVIPRGAPVAGQVAATLIAVQSAGAASVPVPLANFNAATQSAPRFHVLEGAFPAGTFPDERGMIARGAGQSLPCPSGTVLLVMPGLYPECVPLEIVLRTHPVAQRLLTNSTGRM